MNLNGWRRKDVLSLLLVLLLGQVVSFNLAITSFTSSLLSNLGVNTPLTQSFFTYLSLALVYTPILLSQRQKLLVPWYWYALVGFVDVEANYLVVKAYQYSSITSVTLLDCWTIPWVMILTWIFIKTRYSLGQFVGAAICIGGLGLVLLSDAEDSGSGGKNPILGDLLVIGGTFGYAISNVGEEFCVKKRDRVEFIAMLAVFGLIVSMCEIAIFERKNLEAVEWTSEIISLFAAFALSTFVFYTIVPFLMKRSGSALFNLSNLTSDMWAVIIRLFFYHQKLNWLYFLSFAVVAIGLIIYSVTDKNSGTAIEAEAGDSNIQYQVLDTENEISNDEITFSARSEQIDLVT
ncbi:Solute carrier family 35 member f2 [Thalictrum thalictroides]|uniref:Solute carrier family 35 member f2 n=1 Tax=Thalictrum thalictroides TaxID=46969 RepID=A0A7J6VG12_THATH|nr:Solute carrier family 35 member f2 [Thalictrum thalictroides]